MSDFSKVLKQLRKERSLTQTELSKALGISCSTISMYERGEREPAFEMQEAIADYFNVSMDFLHGKSFAQGWHPNNNHAGTGMNDEELKVALFGGDSEVTDDMWDEVKRFAEFVKEKNKSGNS